MQRIGLDLRATEADFKQHAHRGTGRYVREVYQAIRETDKFEIRGLFSSDLSHFALEKLPMLGKRTIETQVLLPRRLENRGFDLVHFFSHGDAPAWGGLPTVVSVLDLIPLIFPDLYSAGKSSLRFKFARYLENSAAKKALGVLAISEATKNDVVKILNISPDKVFVTPLAVNQDFLLLDGEFESKAQFREELKICSPSLLYVGGIDARKNIIFLLEVFRELLDSYHWEIAPKLYFAGRIQGDDKYLAFRDKVSELKLNEQVCELGFVSDVELKKLYIAADVFVFPSFYEGFGLPVLEAMTRGLAVVAGDNSSIPEVVGANYTLCPDNDAQAWTKQIYRLLTDKLENSRLSSLGIERSKNFSWKKTADLTLAAYAKLLERRV